MNNNIPKILIADDKVENIDVLYSLLQKKYEIIVAKNGKEVLNLLDEKRLPDLILLDILMPEMNGFDTIYELKQNPATENIPVIFITSLTEVEDIVKGFNLGAVDYVGKPFNAPELLSRVKTQISLKKQKDLIEQRSKEQKELLQIMCHDLASHFSILKSCVWLAENKEVNLDNYKERIKMATFNGIDIIDLVREMRAVEDKKLPLEKINLITIIKNAVQLHSDNLNKKNIKIDINIPDNLSILAEPRSFVNSVVNNILSNAIKFSYKNSNIVVTAAKKENLITISFKDTGMGIPDALMDQLFSLQKNTNRLGSAGEKGTGFGLPLIKKFIELYGGEIMINAVDIKKDKKNHGTEVQLILKAA